MNFPLITDMSDIAPCSSNVHQPLKGFKRLAISDSVPRSRDNTYSVRFQKHCPEYLIANGRYCYSLPKWIHLDQLQKQISKSTARLPQYVHIIQAVGQKLFLITEKFVFLLLIPFRKLGSLLPKHIVYSLVFGVGIRAQIIQILFRIKKVLVITFLARENE
jgi:hypothetical protein